jgi:CRP-like cAMP-binding protein
MSDAGRRAVQLQQLATALPRLFGELDEAMIEEIEAQVDWIDLHGGSYLFRQGDAGESVYILVSGRLQVVAATDEGGELVLGEIGPGESVGEIALLTGERRTASIRAIRDSVLVEIGHQAFMATVERHPQVAMNLATQVIHQLRDRTSGKKPEPAGAFNIALVSFGDEDLAGELGEAVAAEMQRYGATRRLDSEGLEAASSIAGAATAGKGSLEHTRLTAWLDGCERDHRWVLYQADPAATPWTRRCLRQADLILLVGLAGSESAPGMIETAFLRGDQRLSRAESRLVLLHEGNTDGIEGTAAWLEPRKVERHYHLRRGDSADHARLARYLTGNAVALVLGGGAARGLAHVGIFRALEELGVPVEASRWAGRPSVCIARRARPSTSRTRSTTSPCQWSRFCAVASSRKWSRATSRGTSRTSRCPSSVSRATSAAPTSSPMTAGCSGRPSGPPWLSRVCCHRRSVATRC